MIDFGLNFVQKLMGFVLIKRLEYDTRNSPVRYTRW